MTLEQIGFIFNLILSMTAILLNGEKILSRFKSKSQEKSKHTTINVTNGNLYHSGDHSKIEINLDKAKQALENKEYEKSIRFLYSAIKVNMELDTECNVKLRREIDNLKNLTEKKE